MRMGLTRFLRVFMSSLLFNNDPFLATTIAKRTGGALPTGAEWGLRAGALAVYFAAPLIPGRRCGNQLGCKCRQQEAGKKRREVMHGLEDRLMSGQVKHTRIERAKKNAAISFQRLRRSLTYSVVVPTEGLEPPHPKAHGPEPCASTNSATWALIAATAFLLLIYYFNTFTTFYCLRKYIR